MPDFDPKQIAAPSGHFIGGRLTPGEPVIDVLRPSDCQPMGGIPDASDDLVEERSEPAPLGGIFVAADRKDIEKASSAWTKHCVATARRSSTSSPFASISAKRS